MGGVQKAETPSQAEDGNSWVDFGEYHDWAYAEILSEKPHYEAYICMGSKEISEEQRQFQEWATLKEYEIQAEVCAENSRRN